MRAWPVLVVCLLACGEKKKQKRTGDAVPVVVVHEPVFDGGVGGSVDEVEPNDSPDVATPLAPGGTARGKIDPDSDADYYRIEVAEAGALSVLTSAVDADLAVELEDASGTAIARSDRGAARTREGVPNFGVQPGRYTVIVKRKAAPAKKPTKSKKGAPPPAATPAAPVSYELTARVAAPVANTEREPDDDRGTANDLIVGDSVQGFVGWGGDVDVWKLSVETLSAKTTIDIQVAAVEGVALALELADGVGQPLLARRAPKGTPLVVRGVLPVVAAGAPPFHYLTIKGDKSNPETAYALAVTARPLETDQELEPNDAPDKAMAFPDVKSLTGTWTAGDTDCFAISADVGARTLDVELDPQELDLALELFVDGKTVGKSETAGKGTREKVAGQVPASARAVACVRAAATAVGEGAYTITVTEGAAAP